MYNFSDMHLGWNKNPNRKKKDMRNTCTIAHTCISKAKEIKKMKKSIRNACMITCTCVSEAKIVKKKKKK